jgi:hypothetical protein
VEGDVGELTAERGAIHRKTDAIFACFHILASSSRKHR